MKIELQYTKSFVKSVRKIPPNQQIKLAKLLGVLEIQPYSPLLHTKPLTGKLTGFYSFRITREYRVIFQFIESMIIKLIDIAHRKDIYR